MKKDFEKVWVEMMFSWPLIIPKELGYYSFRKKD